MITTDTIKRAFYEERDSGDDLIPASVVTIRATDTSKPYPYDVIITADRDDGSIIIRDCSPRRLPCVLMQIDAPYADALLARYQAHTPEQAPASPAAAQIATVQL